MEHRARKRFSQNFLHDAHWLGRIVAAIEPRPGERIVEIGPGLAALTAPLIERAAQIMAVEIDRDLAARLRQRFAPEQLTLIEGDALDLDWGALAAADPRPLRIVGNLPYHISSPLLFALVPIADRVVDQHFLLQKEVVDRMVAAPGGKDYGRLSVAMQFRYRAVKLFEVPPGAFTPVPQVTSSVVRLVPRAADEIAGVDTEALSQVVTAAFGQRRKTLRNALSALLNAEQIAAAGIDPGARAETLDVAAFVRLSHAAAKPGTGSDSSGQTTTGYRK
jgi:16S rRNA (adenine1518-N6/adenine1519-N6)-dimethyltransferase